MLLVVASGLALECVLLLGFLRPFHIRAQPLPVRDYHPLATVLGTDLGGALRFAVPVVCGFAAFTIALWLVRGLAGKAVLGIVLAGTVLFSLSLLPTNPLGAREV